MNFEQEYEKMRPYADAEVSEAVGRIIKTKEIRAILSFIYKDQPIEEVISKLAKINTVSDFQVFFSHKAVRRVVNETSDGLTYSGIENIDRSKSNLFISNHRDIVLDSAIMQALLVENNFKTSQITFGSNLMQGQFIIDLGKLNKMFTFYRGGSNIQLYRNASLHSQYLRYVISQKNESVWIAQRDGRTKDGNDKTQLALIKMLAMGHNNPVEALKMLNIIPVSISYEYEPCDYEKARELAISKHGPYVKAPGEDLQSILKGILGYKGKIHLAFGKPLNNVLSDYFIQDVCTSKLYNNVIQYIDNQIYTNFKLNPGNFIAYDILYNATAFLNKEYSLQQKQDFINYLNKKLGNDYLNNNDFLDTFLNIYALPVVNAKLVSKPMFS